MAIDSSIENNVVQFADFARRKQLHTLRRHRLGGETPLFVIEDQTTDQVPQREDGITVLLLKYPDYVQVNIAGVASHSYSDNEVSQIGEHALLVDAEDIELGQDNFETGINNIRLMYHLIPAELLASTRLFEHEINLINSLQ